jgi:hypothetical protein
LGHACSKLAGAVIISSYRDVGLLGRWNWGRKDIEDIETVMGISEWLYIYYSITIVSMSIGKSENLCREFQ